MDMKKEFSNLMERLKTERAVLQERLQLLEQQAHVPQALPPDSVLLD